MAQPKKGRTVARPRRTEAERAFGPIAVTGASGGLGRLLLGQLEFDPRVQETLAIDIRKPVLPLGKTRFQAVDLVRPDAGEVLGKVLEQEQVETLVHAAFLAVPTEDQSYAHELESIGTYHLVNACKAARLPRLILLSTSLVYGASPLHPNFLDEKKPLRSADHQARFLRDRILIEQEVASLAESGQTQVTVLRMAPILGTRTESLATRLLSRPTCPVLMGYDPLVQFTHERDAVAALLAACRSPAHGIFHIASDGVLPYTTVLAMMGKLAIPLPHPIAFPLLGLLYRSRLSGFPPELLSFLRFLCVVDTAKAKRELGFAPHYDIRKIVLEFCEALGLPSNDISAAEEAA